MLNSELWQAPLAGGGDFYTHQIANSFRFDSGYLQRTPSSAGNRQTWTFSCWVKKTQNVYMHILDAGSGGDQDSRIRMYWYDNKLSASSANANFNASTALYRDTSAWQHVVWKLTGGTSYQYVNGTLASSYSVSGNTAMSNTVQHRIGIDNSTDTSSRFLGYMAEVVFIDGTAHDPDDFAETKNGVWIPKDVSGLTFGSQGYHLDFASASDPGNDVSGNNNDWTNNSLATHDQMLDTPTFNSSSNGGNFCTYNPLQEQGTAQKLMALSEGNLQVESTTNDKYHQIIGNMGVKTGKWYIEWYIKAAGYPSWSVGWHHGDGLTNFTGDNGYAGNMQYMGYFTGNNVYITNFGNTGVGDPQVAHASFTNQGAPTTGDVIMCAIDNDAGKCWWGINGVWGDIGSGTGNPATGANASATWTIANYTDHKFPFTLSWANPVAEIVMNCGQEGTFGGAITAGGNADDTGYGNFKYDVPAGFLALCSGNLPIADAVDPAQTDDDYPQKLFNPLTYTASGGDSYTGLGFQPDWVWVKWRGGGQSHGLFDSSRGTSKVLNSDNTNAEGTSSGLTSFDTDGYTMGQYYNQNARAYVSWNWRANGGTTSTNSSGSISVTQQVDPSGGFSISTYSGTDGTPTIGHGLSSAPTFVIVKQTNGTHNWAVYAKGAAATKYGFLESTSGFGTDNMWGNTTPSSTLVYLGAYTQTHGSGRNYVAYCFADTEGYIKSGSYEGNGNVDGAFIYTGFKPAFILIKGIDADGTGWNLHDNATSPFNVASTALQANTASAELSNYNIDMLSNGFKIRDADGDLGTNGNTYIYLAFAKNPFKYATAR